MGTLSMLLTIHWYTYFSLGLYMTLLVGGRSLHISLLTSSDIKHNQFLNCDHYFRK